MKYEILHGEAFPVVEMHLARGEKVRAESDAMVAMDATVDVEGTMRGGVLGGLARAFLSGESFFLQEMVAKRGDGKVMFAPQMPGGIMDVELDGTCGLRIQRGGFLAATEGVEVETKCDNLVRGLFSGAGLFVLTARGKGTVFVSAWGAIHTFMLDPGQEVIIDNGHLVAWPEDMQFEICKASGSWFSSVTSGEALVCRFRGPGMVLIQTRNFDAFTTWVRAVAQKTRS